MAAGIAILIVTIFINAMVIVAIFVVSKRANNNLKRYFVEQTGDLFDKEFVENTKEEIIEEDKPENVVINENVYLSGNVDKVVNYKDKEFKDKYKKLKLGMDFDKADVILDIIDEEESNKKDYQEKAIMKINNEFDFETIYQLSTVDKYKQIEILNSVFDNDEKLVLYNYIKEINNGKFEISEFFNYIKQKAQLVDPNYYVKTGWNEEDFSDLSDKVVTIVDSEIIDGIKIVHKSKIYDFSLE